MAICGQCCVNFFTNLGVRNCAQIQAAISGGQAIKFETTSGLKTAAQLTALHTANNRTTLVLSDGGLVTLQTFITTCGCIAGGGVANTPPTAQNVIITVPGGGAPAVGVQLTGSATYVDANGDLQGVSVGQWYRVAADGVSNRTPIAGATGPNYTPTIADAGFRLRWGFTPVAQTGNTLGAEVLSPATAVVPGGGGGTGNSWVIAASGDDMVIANTGDNLVIA